MYAGKLHSSAIFGLSLGVVWLLVETSGFAFAQEQSSAWFTADQMNAGLGSRPDDLNMETPQSTLESLLALGRQERYTEAAHLLDLSALDPGRQTARGAELAERLIAVLERKIWIHWERITDRPDGMQVVGDAPTAGSPRRDINLGMLKLDGRPVSMRLRRIKVGDDDPVWLFSRQTVDNIDSLYARYGPSELEQRLPGVLRQKRFLGLSYWELIAFPALLGITMLIGFYSRKLIVGLSRRTGYGTVAAILDTVATPAALLLTGIAGYLLFGSMFTFSAPIDTFLTPIIIALFVIAIFIMLLRIFDVFIDRTFAESIDDIDKPENEGDREMRTNLSAARRIALMLAFLIGGGVILLQTTVFRLAGLTLIGSAGVLTLVFGLAAREALSNIFSSLQITLSKSAKIGDAILFEDQWCYVERINFTFIQLKSWDNRRLIVPVTYFATHPFENWTKTDPTLTKTVELVLHHTADAAVLRERFQKFVEDDEDVIDKNDAKVQIVGHSEKGLVMRFYADGRDPSSAWNMQCRLRETMLRAAAELDQGRKGAPLFLPAEREIQVSDAADSEEDTGKSTSG